MKVVLLQAQVQLVLKEEVELEVQVSVLEELQEVECQFVVLEALVALGRLQLVAMVHQEMVA